MPGSSGADDFRAKQEPQFEPVDDLSRFVADRIREAETEPVADQVEPFEQPMAYRYAEHVRKDCMVFRRIAAEYCEQVATGQKVVEYGGLYAAYFDGVKGSMLAVANRWNGHREFKDGWRLS